MVEIITKEISKTSMVEIITKENVNNNNGTKEKQ